MQSDKVVLPNCADASPAPCSLGFSRHNLPFALQCSAGFQICHAGARSLRRGCTLTPRSFFSAEAGQGALLETPRLRDSSEDGWEPEGKQCEDSTLGEMMSHVAALSIARFVSNKGKTDQQPSRTGVEVECGSGVGTSVMHGITRYGKIHLMTSDLQNAAVHFMMTDGYQ